MSIYVWREIIPRIHKYLLQLYSSLVLIRRKTAPIFLHPTSKTPIKWTYPKVSFFLLWVIAAKAWFMPPSQADTCQLTVRLLRLTSQPQQWCHSVNGHILSGNSLDSCSSNSFNVICTANSADNARRRMLLKTGIHSLDVGKAVKDTPSKSYVTAASTHMAVHLEGNLPL